MRLLRRRRQPHDRGESLIEALVTISILGIAVVALLGGILIGIQTSVMHRKQAQAQGELRSWAERISTDLYDACATPGNFAGYVPPADLAGKVSGSVTAVQYWNGTAFVGSCGADSGLQKVTLKVTVAPGVHPGFDVSLDVVVRKPCAPTC